MLMCHQGLSDRLGDNQLKLNTVKQMSEQLSALSHHRSSIVETVGGLQRHHADLVMLVKQQMNRLQQALALRRQYSTIRNDLDLCLKQCRQQSDGVADGSVTMETRLHRLEVVKCTSLKHTFKQ
jgi:hypothetical protein